MSRFLPAVLIACAFAPTARAAGLYDDLLKAVPPYSNTLVLVNVKGAYASPLAQKEKWAEEYFKNYRSGVGFVPPDAELLVIASDVNLSVMTRHYQVGLVKVRNVPSMKELASREGGTEDEIASRLVVLSPRDVYFTSLSGSTLAAVYPADRQNTARWLRYAMQSQAVNLPPYLKAAADAAGDSTLVIATDLQDAIDPTILRLGLTGSPTIVKNKVDNLLPLSRFLAGAKGITFTVKVTDTITGTIRIDFTGDPGPYQKHLKNLFLELVDDQGASIPGLEQWETTYGPNSMTLTGRLTTIDLKRVLSIFAFPGAAGEESPKGMGNVVSAPATQRYLAAVDAILKDIRSMRDSPIYEKTATWHEKAAAQIEHLNRQGVDPAAVEAAFESAKRLRAIGASLRGVPIDLNALDQKAYLFSQSSVGVSIGWGGIRPIWMGAGPVQTNIPQIRAQQAKVIADDQMRRLETWSQIDQILSATKKALQDKYKVPF